MRFLDYVLAQLGGYFGGVGLLAFLLVVAVSSYVMLKRMRAIAFGRKLFDRHNTRSVHSGNVPRLGGLVFLPVLSFFVALLSSLSLLGDNHGLAWLSPWYLPPSWSILLASLLVLLVVGFEDDMLGMGYKRKFGGQVIAVVLLLIVGDRFNFGNLLGLDFVELSILPTYLKSLFSFSLNLLVVLSVVNAFNLIDGIDGLCSGLSVVAFSYYGLCYLWLGYTTGAVVTFMLASILVAFLRMNVFGSSCRQTKMFMGDTGSMMLGFLASYTAMHITILESSSASYLDEFGGLGTSSMLILSPLLVPMFDLVWVFVSRLLRGVNPFHADQTHIHHRVMDLGVSQRGALLIILGLSATFIVVNLCFWSLDANCHLLIDLGIWVLFNIVIHRLRNKTSLA